MRLELGSARDQEAFNQSLQAQVAQRRNLLHSRGLRYFECATSEDPARVIARS